MPNLKLSWTWTKRGRGRRAARGREDPELVFKTFVQLLAQMRASARSAQPPLAGRREQG